MLKGLRMVDRALWRSEAHGLWLGYVPALAYGKRRVSDPGTALRVYDLRSARTIILFYNMEYNILIDF